MIAIAVMVFVFLAGCGTILVVSALVRSWRATAASEDSGEWGKPNDPEHVLDEPKEPRDDDDTFASQGQPARREQATTLRV